MKYFEDINVGDVTLIGTCAFSAGEVRRFAAAFDPQPFHIDEQAARQSPYQGIIASGWHVASVWMKLMVTYWQAEKEHMAANGEAVPEDGPSPGFRNMVWARPVRPGDTLAYRVEIVDKKESRSRKGWGVVVMRSYADNQRGEPTFQFDCTVFCQMRVSTIAPIQERNTRILK